MTRDETTKVLALLKAAYPNSYKGMTKEEAMGTISIWNYIVCIGTLSANFIRTVIA